VIREFSYWILGITFVVVALIPVGGLLFLEPEEEVIPKGPDRLQVICLAENIYFEARNQGTAGWMAVANVTINRRDDSRFPNTICDVVYESQMEESWKTRNLDIPDNLRKYNPVKNRCQFSWYCDGIPDEIYQKQLYREILAFSEAMLAKENILDITDGATHYHADYVLPSWARTKKKTTEIGDHIFYRWAPAARKDF
tara:strand:+ start:311 stop:904 length:594 start_codon:yes stop_codon:yes gene_type:complete